MPMFPGEATRSCVWPPAVIKPWRLHASRYGQGSINRYCAFAGFFNLPRGVSVAPSFGRHCEAKAISFFETAKEADQEGDVAVVGRKRGRKTGARISCSDRSLKFFATDILRL